ncbi:MAG: hypothetical protein NW216_07530 [Hyphomicrobium sp.]|nr:hypothetical protein [Hyphomicrobium sp.]
MTPQAILHRKLRLERRSTEALARWARTFLSAWADERSRGFGGEAAAGEARIDLRRVLETHYAAIVAAFDPDAMIAGETLGLAAVRDPRLAQSLASKAARQADWIIASIVKDLRAAESAQKSDAAVMPKVGGKWSVVLISTLKAVAKSLGTRLAAIANANTQDVSEAVRAAAAARGRITVVPPGAEQCVIVKVWNSLLDGREREAHRLAHNQSQLVENPFEVGGEVLRFPGDSSLGASIGNTINCRCWADYYLQKPDGTRVPLGVATPKLPARRQRAPGAPIGSNRPKTPTISVTFPTGRMSATVVLPDGGIAMMTVRDGAMTIRRGRDVVASASIYRGPDGRHVLGAPSIAPDYRGTGLDGLMRRSVEATNAMADEAARRAPARSP